MKTTIGTGAEYHFLFSPLVSSVFEHVPDITLETSGEDVLSFVSGCKIYSSQTLCNMLFATYFVQVEGLRDHLPPDIRTYFPY